MKKRAIVFAACVLIFSFLFALPAGAITLETFRKYFRSVGASYHNSNAKNLGSYSYWEEQINQKRWTGENRPEALMGDANIDGKVNAKDALFALNFSVYGNLQTATLVNGVKTPFQMRWESPLYMAYKEGTLTKLATMEEQWQIYCAYNSPFFADVTKDCIVNALDALAILKYAVGKAKNFPEGDFSSVTVRFSYYPWPTEYYPGFFEDHQVDMTDEEFCEKYNFHPDVTPTDQ